MVRRFVDRNQMLSLYKEDSTAIVRMNAFLDKNRHNNNFDLLDDVVEENGLINHPAQIYNVDETGMPLDHYPPHLIARKGQRHRTFGKKSQVTVVECVNAAGSAIDCLQEACP